MSSAGRVYCDFNIEQRSMRATINATRQLEHSHEFLLDPRNIAQRDSDETVRLNTTKLTSISYR